MNIEKEFDFTKKPKVTNTKVQHQIEDDYDDNEDEELNNKTVIIEKTFFSKKTEKRLISFLFAVTGLIGMHFNVEYSGWLIFAGLVTL